MPAEVKICGLRRAAEVEAALGAGAAYVGLVFFGRSPRNVSLAEARPLAALAEGRARRVALTVNADDRTLDGIAEAGIDILQLHGAESPERVADLRQRTGLPVMKAVGVAEAADLAQLAEYEAVSDLLLVDAKPPPGGALPGGNGLAFDHELIAGRRWTGPWMLAGGLRPETVAEAVRVTGAPILDVSSGVERAPGVKDPALIAAFCAAARDA